MTFDHTHSYSRRAALRLGLGGLAAVGAAPLLAGCGGGSSTTVDTAAFGADEKTLYQAAKKEGGKLTLYTSSDEALIKNLSDGMKKRYGFGFSYQRLNSSDLSQRYVAEAQAKNVQADAVLTGDPTLADDWAKKGWVATFPTSELPAYGDWPSDYATDYYAIVTINPYSMAINTSIVTDTPNEWSFLTDSSISGKFVTVDLSNVGLVAFPAWVVLREKYGDDFLEKVSTQKLILSDSGPSAVQQLASGAAGVYFPCSLTNAKELSDDGAPVKAIIPDSGPVTGAESPAFMSADAPHPAAAKLFLNYLLTDEGQKILNVVASSPKGVSGTPALPTNYVRPDFAKAQKQHDELIKLLGM
ncbi:MAG: extracellular solute-binding protein [Nocardioides sp.]|uniref:extracellular solute-binding protein n=1 Tax=Nocardioides sp. TaxID=35761 RepID=UPI0039E44A12